MNKSNKLASDITAFRTYAKYLPLQSRRESIEETINRVMNMHLDKFPKLSKDIVKAFGLVHDFKIMPSMRTMQFAGQAVLDNNARSYNCSFLHIDNPRAFSEALFLLLSGTGVGYSVQKHHVDKLPKIQKPKDTVRYLIPDTIEGWAQALQMLIDAYMYRTVKPEFDFSLIRPKGSMINTTGAKAPGPEPLKAMLKHVESKLQEAIGRKLRPIEVSDIICISSEAVLAGGVRRCLPSGSQVHTERGLVSIEDVKVGERVLTTDGYKIVSDKLDQGVQEVLKIQTQNGLLECTAKHRVAVIKDVYGNYEWKQAKDLVKGDRLYFTNEITKGIETKLPKSRYYVSKKANNLKRITIPELDTGIAWLFGLITSSAHVSIYEYKYNTQSVFHITSSLKTPEKTNKIIKELSKFGVNVKTKKTKTGIKIYISSKELIQYFLNFKNSHGKNVVPDFIKKSNQEIRAAFVAGVIDGCNEKNRHNVYLLTSKINYNYIQEIQTLCSSLGIATRITKEKKCINVIYNLNVFGDKNKKQLKEIVLPYAIKQEIHFANKHEHSYGLPYKMCKNIKNDFKRNPKQNVNIEKIEKIIGELKYTPVSVISVEPSRTTQTWDIEVLEKHEFFVNGYLVHNSATIVLFDKTDEEMLTSKSGEWWTKHPYRARANISALMLLNETTQEEFNYVFDKCINSKAGEPGFFFSNSKELGTNPCAEISLKSNGFCNLTTINQTGIISETDFFKRVQAASFIGTLQATYTDYPYLNTNWKKTAEEEALLGVSFTGVADAQNTITPEMLEKGAKLVLETNEKYAKKLGINLAKRTTCLKPEGTASLVLGSSSGIHARHSEYYLRRIRMNKTDALAHYLSNVIPDLVEDDIFSPTTVVVTIPQESPKDAIIRTQETALSLLDRTLMYNKHWVANGHREGENKHNVSVTINYKEDEVEDLKRELWNNRHIYSGVSLLPSEDHTYQQAPFESCTKEKYEELFNKIKDVDLKYVVEETDNTNLSDISACEGGLCVIK